jgi:hypothetical protein
MAALVKVIGLEAYANGVAGVAQTVMLDAVATEVVFAEVAVDAATEEPITVAVGLAVAPVPVPVEAFHHLSQPIIFRPLGVKRPGYGNRGMRVPLESNHVEVKLDGRMIYHYDGKYLSFSFGDK